MNYEDLYANRGKVEKIYLFKSHTGSYKMEYDRLKAGDYIAIVYVGMNCNARKEFVIVKVLSVKKQSFFSVGGITVEFPDGEVETLNGTANEGYSKALNKYLEAEYRSREYYSFTWKCCYLECYLYKDRIALKEDMEAYYANKEAKSIARQKALENKKMEEQERQRKEEQRRRNETVSDNDLRDAFRGVNRH